MVRLSLFLPAVLVALTTWSQRAADAPAPVAAQTSQSRTNLRVFQVKGVVVAVKPKDKQVEIRHEEVPNYMPAMTMPFDVKDTNELAGLAPGDAVAFRMVVTDTDGWIDQIHKQSNTPATNAAATLTAGSPPATGPFRLVRDVEPLSLGERLPEYQLTNQLGQPLSTTQFKGDAVAINFIFTRCPFPAFCPRTTMNFADVQKKLTSLPNGPKNWHLLTISFDPEHDGPEVLKAYAQAYGYDPERWSFATGELIDITAFAEQCGCWFSHDENGSINHNLRTVVVDASGRVRQIFSGNTLTADELAAEIVKAAAGRR